jgi:hypothetical protein
MLIYCFTVYYLKLELRPLFLLHFYRGIEYCDNFLDDNHDMTLKISPNPTSNHITASLQVSFWNE